LNGICISYYNSGQIKIECNYDNDELDGKYTSYYENGDIKETFVFPDDFYRD
jgi:antitoxin component YwqK of YwqJK toxin-antitoxin module